MSLVDLPKVKTVKSSVPVPPSKALEMLSDFLVSSNENMRQDPHLAVGSHLEDLCSVAETMTTNEKERGKLQDLRKMTGRRSAPLVSQEAELQAEEPQKGSIVEEKNIGKAHKKADKDNKKAEKEARKAEKEARKAEKEARRAAKKQKKEAKKERKERKKHKRESAHED